jgi:hypothetical protein
MIIHLSANNGKQSSIQFSGLYMVIEIHFLVTNNIHFIIYGYF